MTLKGKLTFEWLPKTAQLEYNPDLNIFWDNVQGLQELVTETDTQSLSKSRSQRYPLLPIGRDRPPMDSKTYIAALILEPTGKAEVIQTDSRERLRSEFRRIGWVEYTYRHNNSNDRRRYWEERGVEEIVLI